MTKKEFIDRVAEGSGVNLSKQDVAALLDATFKTIGKAVRTEKRFAYPGFGACVLRQKAARQGRNPQTGATLKIKASTNRRLPSRAACNASDRASKWRHAA